MPKNIFDCPLPNDEGYFGEYGGSFIPPELQTIMDEITILSQKNKTTFSKSLFQKC